jgi:hypothetical protein
MRTDPLLHALGADPRVFRPVYRAQRLMLSRPRLAQWRGRQAGSEALLDLVAFAYSIAAAFLLLEVRQPVLGGGVALTMGCGFLLMIVLADHAEALVHPAERLVLAAHPHDDRSLLLARLAAVGRSLALLSAVLFAPACLVAAFRWGPGPALAFLAGAAGAAFAVSTLGLLTAVLIVRSWGRQAMDRLLPWIQGSFKLGFVLPMALSQFFRPEQLSAGTRALLPWLLPTFWFGAPLELAAGGAGPAAAGRLVLAVGSLAFVIVAGGRLATGLGRRLLEPEKLPAPAPGRRTAPSRGLPGVFLRFEGLRLFRLLRVQLRSDWRTRSAVLSLPIVTLILLVLYSRAERPAGGWLVPFLYGWMLLLSASTLTRSHRPESLWWLLASPLDRTRFSLATIPLLRLFMLVPISTAAALLSLHRSTPAGASWPLRLLSWLAFLAYGDLCLILGKVLFPEFPFSEPSSGDGATSGRHFGSALLGGLVSGGGVAAISFCLHFGAPGIAAGGLAAVVLHLPASLWARRRTRRAAARLDLASLG